MSKPTKFIHLVLAHFFVGLAIIGAFLPIMPTAPFLIVGAWFASRGSERLHHKLHKHPQFGKILREWENQGAIAKPTKVFACFFLSLSIGLLCWRMQIGWAFILSIVFILSTMVFILTRPNPV